MLTIRLPDMLEQAARKIATQTKRPIEDVVVDLVSNGLENVPMQMLPDDQVLELTEFMLPEDQQDELGDLLYKQREHLLQGDESKRLTELMLIYRRAFVRKSEALKEAVQRGLMPPLLG